MRSYSKDQNGCRLCFSQFENQFIKQGFKRWILISSFQNSIVNPYPHCPCYHRVTTPGSPGHLLSCPQTLSRQLKNCFLKKKKWQTWPLKFDKTDQGDVGGHLSPLGGKAGDRALVMDVWPQTRYMNCYLIIGFW